MHPILFRIGPLSIKSWGTMFVLGFLLALYLAMRRARKVGIAPENILNLSFLLLVTGLVGARILEILVNFAYYWRNPQEIFLISHGGLVFYGGFILALLVGIWYLRRKKLPVWKVVDSIAPSIILAYAVARWGCFLAGCCYGKPTSLPWGVTFRDPLSLVPPEMRGIPLHPTQIYHSLEGFLIFLILSLVYPRRRFDGEILWLLVVLYSITRFLLEFLRGDVARGFIFIFSTSQFISLLMLPVSVLMLWWLHRQSPGD